MRLLLTLLGIFLCGVCGEFRDRSTYYYWRDYLGFVPDDAIEGGKTNKGRTTYIGQGLHEKPNGKLIPGAINPTDNTLTYYWHDSGYTVKKNIKILCSKHRDDFEWILTDNTAAKSLDKTKLILGGYDTSYELYIGKVHVEGTVAVGKVTLTEPYDAMCYAFDKMGDCLKTQYQILSLK